MSVRAKFTYTGYTASMQHLGYEKDDAGKDDRLKPIKQEMRSLKFAPVYANNDPNHENSKFWKYTPMGSIELGTVNPEAWKHFEIDKEYYVDFTPAT